MRLERIVKPHALKPSPVRSGPVVWPNAGGVVLVSHSDSFTDTDTTRLASHDAEMDWTENRGVWTINSNQLEATSSPGNWSWAFNAGHNTTNQYAEIEVINSGGASAGVFVRGDASGGGYIGVLHTNGNLYISKIDFPTNTATILKTINVGVTTGKVGLEANGPSIKIWLDDVLKGIVADTTYTTGTYCGVIAWPTGTTPVLDDFESTDVPAGDGFGGIPYEDTFTDADTTRLASHSDSGSKKTVWTENRGVWTINGNRLEATSSPAQWSWALDSGHVTTHHYAAIDVVTPGSISIGVLVRADPIGGGGYHAVIHNNGNIYLYRISLGGVSATILATVTGAFSSGRLAIEARGTKISVWLDDVLQASVYDTTYTTGTYCGVIAWPGASPGIVDNYEATDINPLLYELTSTTIGGQAANIYVPGSFSSGVAIIHCHSNNGTQSEPVTGNIMTNTQALLSQGWIVAASAMQGNNWGNQASLDDVVALHDHLVANYSVTKTVIVSQSMGGVAGLLVAAAGTCSTLKGWAGVVPVCNLADMFDGNAGAFAPGIRTAYGIQPDGSDYSTQTAGHDPVLLAGSAFAGLGMRFYASYSDTTVDRTANSDAMSTLVSAHAEESTVVTHTGDHSDASAYMPDDLVSFVTRCLAL